MINRHIESVINNAIQHFPCVMLTGPRQVGKSTLLRNIYEGHPYSYVSLDDTLEMNLADSDPRLFLQRHPYPVIIDEAQKAPGLFVELERVINDVRSKKGNKAAAGMFIISGSTRHDLMDRAEESLAGRVGIISMDSLSISEIADDKNVAFLSDDQLSSIRKAQELYPGDKIFEIIASGNLPQLFDDPDTDKNIFFSSYISTYMEKDLENFVAIQDENTFINFLRLLASNTGEELIYDNYAKAIGIAATTVKIWVSALEKTGIITLIQPYYEQSITKRIVKRPKMYFFDTGLAMYLCGIESSDTLQRSFLKGRMFETFAVNEIMKSFHNAGIYQPLYYYRDNNQNEIDLVFVRDGNLHCVEVKAGTTFKDNADKSFKQLNETAYTRGRNAIVCTADRLSAMKSGTLIVPVTSV